MCWDHLWSALITWVKHGCRQQAKVYGTLYHEPQIIISVSICAIQNNFREFTKKNPKTLE
jgi:hypothetical protein